MIDAFDRFQRGELVVVDVDHVAGVVTVGPRTPEVAYLMAAEERLFAELAACRDADVWKPMDLPTPEPENP